MIFLSSPPPRFYVLEYTPSIVPCARTIPKTLRVWDFTNSSPFERREMVVAASGNEVSFSNKFQWVSSPGTMIAQCLFRDLGRANLFSQVVFSDNPVNAPLKLTGHIFEFAWKRSGGTARALLRLEIGISDVSARAKPIFERSYELESRPFSDDSSESFAKAMSGLVSDLSKKLQVDICSSEESEKARPSAEERASGP